MENHHSPFSGPPSEEDNIRGQHRGLVQSNEHSIDDEIVTHENQCLSQLSEPMELTEEEIFETKLFPGRPDVFGEPEPGPSRVVQRSSGVPETADAIYNRDSFLPRNNSLFPHPQPIAGPFPIGSPIFNAADRAFCKTSCFVQIFKNEFSRYEDDGVCNEIIDFFQRDGLNQLLILNTEEWTPEKAAIAVGYDDNGISLAIFTSHPNFDKWVHKLNNSVLNVKIVFFKDGRVFTVL